VHIEHPQTDQAAIPGRSFGRASSAIAIGMARSRGRGAPFDTDRDAARRRRAGTFDFPLRAPPRTTRAGLALSPGTTGGHLAHARSIPASAQITSPAIIWPMMGGTYDAVPRFDRSRRAAP